MLHRVTADSVFHVEDRPVEEFEDFRENIETHHHQQIGSPGVARRQQNCDQKYQSRIQLYGGIQTQVASSMRKGLRLLYSERTQYTIPGMVI